MQRWNLSSKAISLLRWLIHLEHGIYRAFSAQEAWVLSLGLQVENYSFDENHLIVIILLGMLDGMQQDSRNRLIAHRVLP